MTTTRSAPLCWGQRYVWLNHHQASPGARRELHFVISLEPPPEATVESLRQVLDGLVRRHEALRTTISTTGPVQEVHPPRPMTVLVHETQRCDRPVGAVVADIGAAPFDLATEPPVRACVVTTGTVPKLLLLVGHHTAIDDWSNDALLREADLMHRSIMERRRASLPPVRRHPVDLAREETSPAAVEVNRRALADWDRQLARMPADVFAARRTPAAGPPVSMTLSSVRARAAAHTVAARSGAWTSMVLTAAFTAVTAAYTGSGGVAHRHYAANRAAEGHADLLACLFQPVPVLVDCADDPTLEEVLRRTVEACGEALDNSYCAYDEAMELVSRRSFEQGRGIRLGAALNFLKYPEKKRGGTRSVVMGNPSPTTWAELEDDLYLRVSEWQDCVVVTLNARSTVIGGPDVERFLRGVETALVRMADDAAGTRVSALRDTLGFSALPDDVGVAMVTDALRSVAGVTDALVEPAGPSLTAYVAGAGLTPSSLRTAMLGRLYSGTRCPDHFVVCDRPPTGAAAWRSLPVRVEGSGRLGPSVTAGSAAERALATVVGDINGLAGVSVADSYVAAGGRVLNLPAVREALSAAGWTPPSLYDLASARPLSTVAAALTRSA